MLEIGDIIDRYKVEAIIGTGGTAMVYRVKHEALGTRHALKVLTISSDVIRDRMILEGRVQASMRHPNIVAVTDVLDVDGQPGLLMEYIEGPSLHKALKEYKLPLAAAEMLFNGIVSAVRAAHALGLVHRDLKPANVLLARVGDGFVPKVTDFGLAKMVHESEETGHGHTRAGIAMGTPAYMASEQIRDAKTVDQRADIFSLGCMLYELACGQRAFPGDDAISIYNSVIKGVYTPPRQLVPGLPERIDAAIRGALVTDRKHRIPDCDTLLRVFHGEEVWELNEASEPELDADPPTTESARPAHPDAPELRITVAPPMDDEESGVRRGGLMPLGGQFLNLDDQTTDMRDDGVDPLYATIGAAGAHIEPYNMPAPEPTVEVTHIPVAPPPRADRTSIVVWGGFAMVVAGVFFGALVLLWATGLFGGQGAPAGGRVKPTHAASGTPASEQVDPAGTPALPADPGSAPAPATSPPAGSPVPPAAAPVSGTPAPAVVSAPREPTPRPVQDPEPAGSNPPMNPTPRPIAPVTVKILSAPPTADLVVDGREAGRTPAKLDLKPGEHSVVLTSGEQIARFKVVVGPEGEQRWCYAFATQTLAPGACPR